MEVRAFLSRVRLNNHKWDMVMGAVVGIKEQIQTTETKVVVVKVGEIGEAPPFNLLRYFYCTEEMFRIVLFRLYWQLNKTIDLEDSIRSFPLPRKTTKQSKFHR